MFPKGVSVIYFMSLCSGSVLYLIKQFCAVITSSSHQLGFPSGVEPHEVCHIVHLACIHRTYMKLIQRRGVS